MEGSGRRRKWPWVLVAVVLIAGTLIGIGVMRWGQVPDADFKALMDEQARKILKAAIRAKGGLTAISNIKDITVKSKSKVFSAEQGELEFQVTVYIKLPDKLKQIASAKDREMMTVLNGDKGWLKSGDSVRELPGEVIRSLKEQIQNGEDFIFLNATKSNYQFKYVGTGALNETRAHVIQMVDPDGSETKLYLDIKSYHLIKIAYQEAEEQIETLFSDYRRLGGIMTPFRLKEYRDGKLVSETQIEETKFNSGLSDELFKRPE